MRLISEKTGGYALHLSFLIEQVVKAPDNADLVALVEQ